MQPKNESPLLKTIQMFSRSIKHFNNALNLLTGLGKLGMVILEVPQNADD
ncbi:MAG: hypothetical protein KTR27_03780 [Leptolyngbyaceae cyanobacterium MAG.088]|nr:hypothetical protein [Leptolyngbyaceae cyanobacterium MAG.088]